MPEIRDELKEFDELIERATALKERLMVFRETGFEPSIKQTRTLQLLESASDHIVDNLTRMKQRILTDLGGG